MSALFDVLLVSWKLMLVGLVAVGVLITYTDHFMRYSSLVGQIVFSLTLIGLSCGLFFFVSPSQPFASEFWTSWRFVDDAAVMLLTYGTTSLARTLQFLARSKAT